MKIVSSLDEAQAIAERQNRDDHDCDLCLDYPAEVYFTFQMGDGDVVYAELCRECTEGIDTDQIKRVMLAIRVMQAIVDRNEVRAEVLEWLIAQQSS